MAYFDAAVDRIRADVRRQFVDAVDASRMGLVTAYDQKSLDRWIRSRDQMLGTPHRQRGASGAELERQMMALAATRPDLFVWGERP